MYFITYTLLLCTCTYMLSLLQCTDSPQSCFMLYVRDSVYIHMYSIFLSFFSSLLIRLKNETRWSACFYAYLAAVVAGMKGDLKQSRELFLQCGRLVKRKNNNLEKFCSRRVRRRRENYCFWREKSVCFGGKKVRVFWRENNFYGWCVCVGFIYM